MSKRNKRKKKGRETMGMNSRDMPKSFEGSVCNVCKTGPDKGLLCAVNSRKALVHPAGSDAIIECWSSLNCSQRLAGVVTENDGADDPYESAVNKYTKGGYTGTTVMSCRHEPTHVFSLEGIEYYGGSRMKVEEYDFAKNWMVVSCLGYRSSYSTDRIWSSNKAIQKSLQQFSSVKNDMSPTITVEWSDMCAPPLKAGFWNELHSKVKEGGYTKVLFYCEGGHGRTGTALAAMLVECCVMKAKAAADLIHEKYCKKAIETSGQSSYLKSLYITAKKAAKLEVTQEDLDEEPPTPSHGTVVTAWASPKTTTNVDSKKDGTK